MKTPRGMEIIVEIPPFIHHVFNAGLKPNLAGALFAYGDTLYIPGGLTPPPEIMAHEDVHMRQQEEHEGGVDAWWERYLGDAYFRMEQELQAYTVQLQHYNKHHKDRNQQIRYQTYVADQLAGPLYGNVIGKGDALRMLRHRLNNRI